MKYSIQDFGRHPMMFYYEVTQACDLVCRHCRACAQPGPRPGELDTDSSKQLLEQIASFERPPVVVMTGGDPLKRADIFELIDYARDLGLEVALTPSATPLATQSSFQRAHEAGVRRIGLSLDGPEARTHDCFRGFDGSFDRTLEMIVDAQEVGLPVQINTSITRRNVHLIDAMAELLSETEIEMWSLFFLVPIGRGVTEQRITPIEYEVAFEQLWRHSQVQPYAIKTTEAPHYRRWVLQHQKTVASSAASASDVGFERKDLGMRAPLGVRDGKGIMFVGHDGEIYPAGFLPVRCGKFPNDSVVDVYQKNAAFVSLRDASQLEGKCGVCEYREICGGSRSRAFAVSGNMLGSEPDCVYIPKVWRDGHQI